MSEAKTGAKAPAKRSGGIVTLGQQFAAHNDRTTGFDYARIILAFAVLAWHSYAIVYGQAAVDAYLSDPILAVPILMIVPVFFALSGFLVTMSLYRANSLKVYLIFRGLRLFPALTVEIVLAAMVLGPLVTTLTLGAYFSDGLFYKYFLNVVGLVQYVLPGVFEGLPIDRVVNGSLWTVPYELEVYIYLALFFAIGVYRNRYFVLLAFVLVTALVMQLEVSGIKGLVVAIKDALLAPADVNPNLQAADVEGAVSNVRLLVPSFFAGSVLYAWRDQVPLHWALGLVSFALSYYLLTSPELYLLAPLPLAYVIVWFGMQVPPLVGILKRGDYSYGVYLYAFPIQQSIAMTGVAEGNFLLHAGLSAVVTFLFAMFSWHVVEKPSLRLKSRFM